MADIKLYPLNDLALLVTLKDVDALGKVVPLTTGSVTTFLALDALPLTDAADSSLFGTVTHVGNGVWLVKYEASTLDPTLLDGLFAASGVAYLIVQQLDSVRSYAPLTYMASRLATVT